LYIIYFKLYLPRHAMSYLEIPAYAKINLSLDVTGKREDGYHDIRTIMQTVSLHDTVCLETTAGKGISLECGSRWVPENENNTAWKAAKLMMDSFGIKKGLRIRIVKRIPVAAGLAGGSSDAAAVLKGMNQLFSLKLDVAGLQKLGRRIGADVPYCIEGGTRLAEGIGDILSPLPDFSGIDVVIIKPDMGVSTPWVYKNLVLSEITGNDRPDTERMIRSLAGRDVRGAAAGMKNVLELVTLRRYPKVREAKDCMEKSGAAGSLMSGSGPSVFGLFCDSRSAQDAFDALSARGDWQCHIAKTI